MNTIGHNILLDYFTKLITNDRVHHAYCFVGSEHVGKRHVVDQLAKKILGIKILETSQDVIYVKREINPKTGKTKKDISIEQIKQLRHFLSMTSASGGYKIAIIEQAERMNTAASNALLKTLEEPTKKTIIFLTVQNDDMLLPTILSRVHLLRLSSVDTQLLQTSLQDTYGNDPLFDQIIGWSQGLPGLAIKLLTDEQYKNQYQQEIKRFDDFINKPFSDKLKMVTQIFGDKSDHIIQRQYIIFVLNIWQAIIQDIWRVRLGEKPTFLLTADVTSFDNKLVVSLLVAIDTTKNQLQKNIHPKLSVEQILLLIP